jgi:excisionase family DNA binding protein
VFTITDMERRKLTSNGHQARIDAMRRTDARASDLREDARLPRLLDTTKLAEHLAVPPRHVRRLVAERRVPYLKLGRLVRFDPAEISAWLEEARRSGGGASQGS